MKKVMTILGLSALCMVSGAETVNFTADEGYTVPAQLKTYPGWNGSVGFMLNTNGTGTVDFTGNYIQMNFETGIEANVPEIETSIQFRMAQASGYVSGWKPVVVVQLEKDAVGDLLANDGLNDVRAYIQRTSATTFNMAFNNGTDGSNDSTLYNGFSESLIGLSGVNGDDSDLLELKLVLHRGATETNWTADIILSNITSNSVVSQVLGRAFESPYEYFTNTLYGAFSSGLSDAGGTGVDQRQIESFSASGSAVGIDFTADEGYVPGNLTGQGDWNGSVGFQANPNGSGTVDFTGNLILMNYENGLAATSPTNELSVRFRMKQAVDGYASGLKPILGIAFEQDAAGVLVANDGLNDVRTYIQRTSINTFQLVFNNATAGTSDATLFSGFSEALLGLNGVDGDDSDLLELKLVLHRGSTEFNWTADAILSNITSNSVVFQTLGKPFESPTGYFNSALYGAFLSGSSDGDIGVNNRQIEFFTLSGGPATSVVPPTPGYDGWAEGWGVELGASTDDYDGDGLANIYEYGLGGNPTDELSQGTSPTFATMDIGGTNFFSYIHPQLAADQISGLTYSLALRADLILGDWATNTGYSVTGTNITGGTLDFVTNITSTVEDTKFIQLIIE